MDLRPNKSELLFFTLAYNRFYDIYDEVIDDTFIDKDYWYRLSKIKDAFALYTELLNYEPLKSTIDKIKELRPPMESEIASELFKFVRNVITHFPFFDKWDEIYVQKPLVNWYKDGQTIDKFIRKYIGHPVVKYRFWEEKKKRMTYLSINFPTQYDDETKIFLKDILSEQEGIKFSFILMKQVIDTQVEN
jgi:hypothetical protein